MRTSLWWQISALNLRFKYEIFPKIIGKVLVYKLRAISNCENFKL